jgi:hypothetical protein
VRGDLSATHFLSSICVANAFLPYFLLVQIKKGRSAHQSHLFIQQGLLLIRYRVPSLEGLADNSGSLGYPASCLLKRCLVFPAQSVHCGHPPIPTKLVNGEIDTRSTLRNAMGAVYLADMLQL